MLFVLRSVRVRCGHGLSHCLDCLLSGVGVQGGTISRTSARVSGKGAGKPFIQSAGRHRLNSCHLLQPRKALEHLHLLMKHGLDLIK